MVGGDGEPVDDQSSSDHGNPFNPPTDNLENADSKDDSVTAFDPPRATGASLGAADPLVAYRASVAAADPLKAYRASLAAADPLKAYRASLAAADPLKAYRASLDAADPLKAYRASLAAADPLKAYRASLDAADPLKAYRASLAAADPLKAYRASLAAADPLKTMRTNLNATSWVASFDAKSVSARLSRSITTDLLSGADSRRRPRIVDRQFITDLVGDVARSAPDIAAPELLAETLKRSSSVPVPLAQDSLLSDDTWLVENWISSVLQNFLAASGLDERDLLEDSVAAMAYMATMAVAVAVLINYPALLLILAPTGMAGKDPAAYMSRLARRGFRLMNES